MTSHSTICTARAGQWLAGALACLLAAGCQPQAKPAPGRVAAPAVARTAVLDHEPAGGLRAHAFAAFVAPLIDDGEPPRFTDLHQTLTCADHSVVRVDGRAVVAGDLVPPGSFVLQWDMDLYCPYGIAGPLLNGRADVMVFRDDEQGMTALLGPVSLDVLDPPLLLDDSDTRSAQADAALTAAVRTVSGR